MRRGDSSAAWACGSAAAGSAATFFAREGRAGRGTGAASGAGTGFASGVVRNGSSGLVDAADFLATFFAATFLTAAFLAVAFFAVVLVAAFLATRLMAGGASPAVPAGVCGMVSSWVWLLIRNG